jgi:hypothetical protein
MTDVQIIITSVIGVLTILGGVYTAVQARRANKESTVVTAYDALVKNLQAQEASQVVTIKAQSDRIVLLERRIELFVRWGRAVIRWYEFIELPDEAQPLPTPHPILELNGDER